jgi:hypothetical protein
MYDFIRGEQLLNFRPKTHGAKKEKKKFPYQANSSLFMLLTINLVLLLVYFDTLNGRHLVPNA